VSSASKKTVFVSLPDPGSGSGAVSFVHEANDVQP
jgi:S-adenosylmethionine hydrolase